MGYLLGSSINKFIPTLLITYRWFYRLPHTAAFPAVATVFGFVFRQFSAIEARFH